MCYSESRESISCTNNFYHQRFEDDSIISGKRLAWNKTFLKVLFTFVTICLVDLAIIRQGDMRHTLHFNL